ncbi:MAG: LLM class flavin-dependent oxidoreductase [Angustibacter sp.]
MTDYGHPLRFGTFLTPLAATAHRVVDLAVLTEQVGLDLVTVQDHPYQARFLDTWTLLSVIAARTERVTVAPNVANLPLRPPVVLARSVATLDLLSEGRVELGLGAGGFADAIVAVGGPRLSASERVDALEEALRVVRAVWDEGGARSIREDGEHYRIRGAHPGPRPAHDVEIWLGALKPRMLRITGAHADGWLPSLGYVGVDALGPLNAAIDAAATDAGRDPGAVRRLYNVHGDFRGEGRGFLQGPAALWVEQLAELTLTQGMSTYLLASDDPDDIRRFGAEVAPGVRELVAAERSDPAPHHDEPEPARERVEVPPRPAAPNLGVVPTPDDGTRLSAERPWDESARPTGPAPDAGRTYSAQEQAAGQHLVDVHDALRSELTQLRDLVEQVSSGHAGVGDARSHIATMTLRQNNWTLGVYCASYCRIVTGHHSLEDQSVFPHLRSRDPRLAPVIDRLEAEHHVISAVLERVDQALVAMVSAPDGLAQVRAAVDLLTDTLLSHLSYEERELVEPLARWGFF